MSTINHAIIIDEENSAEDFWASLPGRLGNAPAAIRTLHSGGLGITVYLTAEEAEAVERWCQTVPGWTDEDAPIYAPHALVFVTEDDRDVAERRVRGDVPEMDEHGSIIGWMQPG